MNFEIAFELNELFFAASAQERRLILLTLEATAAIASGSDGMAYDPAIGKRLEAAALSRRPENFAHHLALALKIPRRQAERIARDEHGEVLVVAAKALLMPRDLLYRLLIFVNPAVGQSVVRVHALADLFDEISLEAAAEFVAIWQALHQHERSAGKHRPQFWNDETRARMAITAQRRRPAARRDEKRDVS